MPSPLAELCKHMQSCTDKMEEEIKNNYNECYKFLLCNEASETKLALERAKDYHYKEILSFLREIVTNIKKMIIHEEKIRSLSNESNFTPEELKRYSYVQRQVNAFSKNSEEVVKKREKRRVASEVSLESLEAWEAYLENKAAVEEPTQEEKCEIPKRMNNRRRKKKFVSSTFNNFLDKSGERRLDSILEGGPTEDLNLEDRLSLEENAEGESESILELPEETGQDESDQCEEQPESNSTSAHEEDENSDYDEVHTPGINKTSDEYSLMNTVECISREHLQDDSNSSKPKIVDVVYKKKGN